MQQQMQGPDSKPISSSNQQSTPMQHAASETASNISNSNTEKGSDTDSRPPEVNNNVTSSKVDDSTPPDGGYGWVIVLGCFLINFNSWGINSSYGVFLAYYLANDYFPGATYLDFAFVGGLSIGVAMLVAPLATNSVRMFGTKVALTIGIVFETVALITAGSARQIWQLFLSQGVAFGIGMGFLFVASVGLAPQWFDKKRSLANGVCAAGSGIGALTYNLACQSIIQRWGLPWAFRVLGICAFCATTFSTIIVKDRNIQVGARTVGLDLKLFRRWEFCLLQAWGFFSMLGYVVLLFSLPNYAKTIGLTSSQGSIISALLNLGQGLGRPPVGYFSDSLGRINMAASMTLLPGIFALAIWIPAKSYGVLIFFALIGGTVLGTFWATVGPVAAEVVGLRDLPSALSVTWVMLVLPTTFSEPIALEIVQKTPAAYLGAQLFAGFMYIAAALCLVPVRGWKIRDLERKNKNKSKTPDDTTSPATKDNDSAVVDEEDTNANTTPPSSLFACMWKMQKV